MMTTLAGPCDSPAVVILKACPKLLPDTHLLLAGRPRRRKSSAKHAAIHTARGFSAGSMAPLNVLEARRVPGCRLAPPPNCQAIAATLGSDQQWQALKGTLILN